MNTIVIGIAGGTGSGKTTLARKLQEAFQEDVSILSHDYYYKATDGLTFEERKRLNYDHPNAFDTDLMITHLRMLREGVSINRPIYSFVDHNRVPETVPMSPTRVIIVEGILIFENPELRDLMDIKVFVDTDADVRLIRRILRDVKDRGRDLDSVVGQYLATVKPMHEQFVDPSKKYADVIIPEGGFNSVAIRMLLGQIQNFLSEN